MLRNWQERHLFSTSQAVKGHSKSRESPGSRFVPVLERLEARHCPSLSVANNLNLSKMLDNQSDETIAINPNNPQQMFVAATSFHGGYDGASYAPCLSGLFYAYSSNGGTTWTSGIMATGTDGTSAGYGLPAAGHFPHAAFDKFGNLFLTYVSDYYQYQGSVSSFNPSGGTLTDNSAHWFTNEWAGLTLYLGPIPASQSGTFISITSNDSTTLHFNPIQYQGTPATFAILSSGSSYRSLEVAQSIDGGTFSAQTNFAWLKSVNNFATGPNDPEIPLAATGPGTQPGTGTAGGSIWIGWNGTDGKPTAMGAFTSGLGLGTNYVNSFQAPIEIPTQPTTYIDVTGLSVGKSGQVLIGWDTQLIAHYPNPPQAQVNVAEASGLSATQFSNPVTATWSNVYKGYSIPANQPNVIDANPQVAYDLSTATTNRVYLVYTDAPDTTKPNATNIYEIYSDNDGSSWSSPKRVNDEATPTNSHFLAADAVDPTSGNLAVSWYDARNDTGNVKVAVYGTVSSDHGSTFASNALISHLPNSSTVAQSNGTIANLESKGTITAIDPNGGWLTDSGQDWTISPYDWWMQLTSPHFPYPFSVSVQLNPSTLTLAQIADNNKTTLTLTGGWNNGTPSTGMQYLISADGESLGDYIGLAYYNGKFWPAWADNSNSTGDNPNINKSTPPNPNDYQLNVYTAPVTVTLSARNSAGASVAHGAALGQESLEPSSAGVSIVPPPSSSKLAEIEASVVLQSINAARTPGSTGQALRSESSVPAPSPREQTLAAHSMEHFAPPMNQNPQAFAAAHSKSESVQNATLQDIEFEWEARHPFQLQVS